MAVTLEDLNPQIWQCLVSGKCQGCCETTLKSVYNKMLCEPLHNLCKGCFPLKSIQVEFYISINFPKFNSIFYLVCRNFKTLGLWCQLVYAILVGFSVYFLRGAKCDSTISLNLHWPSQIYVSQGLAVYISFYLGMWITLCCFYRRWFFQERN